MTSPVLIVPGIGNSGPQHWQSLWEASSPHFQRVMQNDWDHPICAEWVAALEQAVAASGPETILVVHSLGCLAVAHWAASTQLTIKGAMLVAVPDPAGPSFPAEAVGFDSTPQTRLPFESIVVASTNDPYGSLVYTQRMAELWDSLFVIIGDAGHINASSGLGEWPEGRALLESLK
jgi:uncharacterized protein